MSSVDVAVFVGYLVSVAAFGVWLGWRRRTAHEFMVAGGKLPGWAVGLSIFGTYVSSISFLALPGKAYAANWNPFVFSLSIPLTAWIAVRWFVPFYRKGGEVSAYAHLERRFGAWARTYAVACYILSQLARTGVILYLVALALSGLTGWRVESLILVGSAGVIAYAFLGGMESVIWTDAVQSAILIGGALLCAGVLAAGTPGGPAAILEIGSREGKFSLGSFGPGLSEATVWVVLLYGLSMNLQNFGIDQSFVQRYVTARSDLEAERSVWLGALLYLPISAAFLFIGTALYAHYATQPGRLPDGIPPDKVFPHFIATALPAGAGGIVVAALMAAAQSTVSSSVNCAATLVLCDLYRRHLRPAASDRESLLVLRLATAAFGCAGTAIALVLAARAKESALDAWWALAGIASGGMLGLFLLGILSRKATGRGAAVGVLFGVAAISWMSLSPLVAPPGAWWRSPLHTFLVTVVGTLAIFFAGLAVSWALDRRGWPRAPRDGWRGTATTSAPA
ncbi:MAG: sodium:solute symporter [Planctomycetota bacterium]